MNVSGDWSKVIIIVNTLTIALYIWIMFSIFAMSKFI